MPPSLAPSESWKVWPRWLESRALNSTILGRNIFRFREKCLAKLQLHQMDSKPSQHLFPVPLVSMEGVKRCITGDESNKTAANQSPEDSGGEEKIFQLGYTAKPGETAELQ